MIIAHLIWNIAVLAPEPRKEMKTRYAKKEKKMSYLLHMKETDSQQGRQRQTDRLNKLPTD